MRNTTAVVLGRHIRIASNLDQFERQMYSDIKKHLIIRKIAEQFVLVDLQNSPNSMHEPGHVQNSSGGGKKSNNLSKFHSI